MSESAFVKKSSKNSSRKLQDSECNSTRKIVHSGRKSKQSNRNSQERIPPQIQV